MREGDSNKRWNKDLGNTLSLRACYHKHRAIKTWLPTNLCSASSTHQQQLQSFILLWVNLPPPSATTSMSHPSFHPVTPRSQQVHKAQLQKPVPRSAMCTRFYLLAAQYLCTYCPAGRPNIPRTADFIRWLVSPWGYLLGSLSST